MRVSSAHRKQVWKVFKKKMECTESERATFKLRHGVLFQGRFCVAPKLVHDAFSVEGVADGGLVWEDDGGELAVLGVAADGECSLDDVVGVGVQEEHLHVLDVDEFVHNGLGGSQLFAFHDLQSKKKRRATSDWNMHTEGS